LARQSLSSPMGLVWILWGIVGVTLGSIGIARGSIGVTWGSQTKKLYPSRINLEGCFQGVHGLGNICFVEYISQANLVTT
jgi:hypothetical protein